MHLIMALWAVNGHGDDVVPEAVRGLQDDMAAALQSLKVNVSETNGLKEALRASHMKTTEL